MSLAIDIARRRASGFGAWSDFELPQIEVPPDWTPGGESDNGEDNTPPWYVGAKPIIDIAGRTLSSIFGNRYQQPTTTAYRPPSSYQYDPALLASRNNQGVGIGLDSNGVRLSDGSHIGWFPIIGVIGFFFVLQSRPLTRK